MITRLLPLPLMMSLAIIYATRHDAATPLMMPMLPDTLALPAAATLPPTFFALLAATLARHCHYAAAAATAMPPDKIR